jgi:hypothetical protein
LIFYTTSFSFAEEGRSNLTLFPAQHDWVWLGLRLDASSRKARPKFQNTSQGRHISVKDVYPCHCLVSRIQTLICVVQSVCRSTEKPGNGLQAWAAKVQRQRNSRLVLVPYQVGFLITTFQMVRYDRQVSSLRKRVVHSTGVFFFQ